MAARTQAIRHLFRGGWATDFGPTAEAPLSGNLLEIPFLTDAENVVYDFDGGPHKMPGSDKLNSSALESGATVRGVFDYWRQGTGGSATQKRVVHVNDHVYVDNADGSFSSILSGLEVDAVPNYTTMDDILVIASDSTSDVPQYYDGTTARVLGTNTPNFAFSVVYKNRLWAAGDATKPSRLYYSPTIELSGADGDWTKDGGYIDVNPGDGDRIMGLVVHKDSVFVFKGPYNGSIHRLTGDGPFSFGKNEFSSGGISLGGPNLIFTMRDDIGFLDSDGEVHSLNAVAAFGDFKQANLSRPIAGWLEANLNLDNLTRGWAVDSRAGYALIACSSRTETDNDLILMLDYRFEFPRWAKWTTYCSTAMTLVSDQSNGGQKTVFIGCEDGFVRRLGRPTRSKDGTTSIAMKVTTPHLHYGNPVNKKTIYQGALGITPKGTSTITVGWQRDDDVQQTGSVSQSGGDVLAVSTSPLDPPSGAFTLDSSRLAGARFVDRFLDMDGEFRSIAYEFSENTNNVDAEIHSWTALIAGGTESWENG